MPWLDRAVVGTRFASRQLTQAGGVISEELDFFWTCTRLHPQGVGLRGGTSETLIG